MEQELVATQRACDIQLALFGRIGLALSRLSVFFAAFRGRANESR